MNSDDHEDKVALTVIEWFLVGSWFVLLVVLLVSAAMGLSI